MVRGLSLWNYLGYNRDITKRQKIMSHLEQLVDAYIHCITMAQNCQEGKVAQDNWYFLSDTIGEIICAYDNGLAHLASNVKYKEFINSNSSRPFQ